MVPILKYCLLYIVEIRTQAVSRNVMHLMYSIASPVKRISIIRAEQGHLNPMNCHFWTAYLSENAELGVVEKEIQNDAITVKVTPQSKYQSYSRRRGKTPRILHIDKRRYFSYFDFRYVTHTHTHTHLHIFHFNFLFSLYEYFLFCC
jgi:hypothetical protein